jgi:beta-galactosidase
VQVSNGRQPLFFNFRGVAEKGIVFINGKQVAKQTQRNKPLMVPYDGTGTTTITVLAESRGGNNNRGVMAGLSRPVEIVYKDDQFITGWRMKGGPGDMDGAKGWEPLKPAGQFDRPYFFKNTFRFSKSTAQVHPMWRVTFQGLSQGFIFVNGHNIGGYPERVPINSLYIPETWLKEGENSIIIYDQYGNRPDKIEIAPEVVASRNSRTVNL